MSALIDGDGSVTVRPQRSIQVSVTDPEIIDAAEDAFRAIGVNRWRRSERDRTPSKTLYSIHASGRMSFRTLAGVLNLRHPDKRRNLEGLVASYGSFGCSSCGCDLDEQDFDCETCTTRHYARGRRDG